MNIFNNSELKIYRATLYQSSKVNLGFRLDLLFGVHEFNNIPRENYLISYQNRTYRTKAIFSCVLIQKSVHKFIKSTPVIIKYKWKKIYCIKCNKCRKFKNPRYHIFSSKHQFLLLFMTSVIVMIINYLKKNNLLRH